MKFQNSFRFIAGFGLLLAIVASGWTVAASLPFTPGNLVVYRVGEGGSASLANTGNPVFVDEFTPSGQLVQSIALPISSSGANHRLIASGTAVSEGLLTRSTNGQFLVLTGYDAAIPTTGLAGTSSASVPRVAARIDANGNIDTSTALTDFSTANNPRGAASADGVGLWVSGASGGVRFVNLGATTSTPLSSTVTNIRSVEIFNGQLYVSNNSGTAVRLGAVGSGLPTTAGQTIANLPGFANSTGSPYAFFFADLDAGVPGLDTLYVADDGAGISKYSLVAGAWVLSGTAGDPSDAYRGLTGFSAGGAVTLYATRNGGSGANGGGELISVLDISGYNGAFSATPNLLATAGPRTAFRGVAFAPGAIPNPVAPSIVSQPASSTISSGTPANLSVSVTGTTPFLYQWYRGSRGDTSIPVGTNSANFISPPLTATASFWVRVSNSGGFADSDAATITVNFVAACSAAYLPIHAVQGNTETSPLSGMPVTVHGVVIGDYEGPSPTLRGFYVQDLAEDTDSDPATSEGVFVFENDSANRVSLGQVVHVTGTVDEFQGQTEINASLVENCGTTATIVPADVMLPTPPDVQGVAYLERFEGMLVRFHQTLYVTENFQLGQFGQIVMSANGRLPEPTSIVPPGTQAQTLQNANNLNRIVIDDDLQNQNPDPILFGLGGNPLSAVNTLRSGDSASNIIGVLTYTWAGSSSSGNAYRLRPVHALGGGVPNFISSNPRPAAPPAVHARLKIAGMNVLNFFLTLDTGASVCGPLGHKQQCRGAETALELERQQTKLNQALLKLDADIFGLAELENTQNASGADVNPLADIVARLNQSLGGSPYSYINTGVIGSDAIRTGIIYRTSRVTPIGSILVDNNPVHNRPPIAQLFSESATGQRFTVIVNHFKSKGCSGGSAAADTDLGDGQGCFNATRADQAKALLTFINSVVIPATGDPDVLLVGDFNSYAKEDPIRIIEEGGFSNLISRYSGKASYSYAFDGQWGYLDHALASNTLLAQVTGAGDYHINSDEPTVLDYNTQINGSAIKNAGQIVNLFNADEFRTSDHDPVVIGLNLRELADAKPDSYSVQAGGTLSVAGSGVLSNDSGAPLSILNYTNPGHGALVLNDDGSFRYTPAAGFTGKDTFTYTATNGALLKTYSTNLPPLASIGGVNLTAAGFGSSFVPVPGSSDEYFGLTDRGPNVDGPGGTTVEPLPAFTPAIGRFKLTGSQAVLENVIPLQAADGTPYSGRANSLVPAGEVITDLNGIVLPPDINGYDSEGLVALADGTFWVSDEYGPFITHFDATGKQLSRLSPFDGTLPRELSNRIVNRGMEGLTITPDGSTLVGIMQSALMQPDLGGFDAKRLTPVRIMTYRLSDGLTREFLYLLDNPAITATAVSEIAALSNTTFLVLERDGNFPPDAYKKLFKVDISAATDVGPNSTVAGSIYNAASGGLLLAGQSLEVLVKGQDAADSQTTFDSKGIHPGTKTLHTDIAALLNALDSSGRFFSHDKLEGLAVANAGATLLVSNDSDFGIDGLSNSVPPFRLHAKRSPVTGEQDDGEILAIDAIRSTATVTIEVVDTTAPETFIDSMPVNPSTSTAATFTFRGNDGGGSGVVRFECSLDNAPFSACTSPVTLAALGIGNHSFAVRAVDAANNADASPAAFEWGIVPDNPASIVGSISSKSGPVNGRAWSLTLNNDGIVTAVNAQILGFTLTQTFGAACTPVVAGGFPIALGTIAPGTSANASITIDFTGCVSTARFTLTAPFSANAGAFKGSIVRYNQFQ